VDIDEVANQVQSRADFEDFLRLLMVDLHRHGQKWANTSLAEYLGGFQGFTQDMDGYYKNRGEDVDLSQPSWRVLADLLLAARVYE